MDDFVAPPLPTTTSGGRRNAYHHHPHEVLYPAVPVAVVPTATVPVLGLREEMQEMQREKEGYERRVDELENEIWRRRVQLELERCPVGISSGVGGGVRRGRSPGHSGARPVPVAAVEGRGFRDFLGGWS